MSQKARYFFLLLSYGNVGIWGFYRIYLNRYVHDVLMLMKSYKTVSDHGRFLFSESLRFS